MSIKPRYNTETFCDVYDKAEDFVADYKASGLYDANNKINDTSATTLYYLLYAQYGNSPIFNNDVNQFKYKMWSTIYKFGPSWEKRLSIQSNIRQLTLEDIQTGSQAIYDHSLAMGDDNITAKTDPTKIDQKTGTYYTKSKMDAYGQLWTILKADVTNEFLSKFKICFKQFVMPERPVLYVTEVEEDE